MTDNPPTEPWHRSDPGWPGPFLTQATLHPFDELVALYLPEKLQAGDFYSGDLRKRAVWREVAYHDDRFNLKPKVPPQYTDVEYQTLQAWREQVLGHIDSRITGFQSIGQPGTAGPSPLNTAANSNQGTFQQHNTSLRHHRALDISELLDSVLGFCDPKSHFATWNVCKSWRHSTKSVIGSKSHFYTTSWCGPVQYGQRLDPNVAWPAPNLEEIEEFGKELARAWSQVEGKDLYFPARLTQLYNLPQWITTNLDRWFEWDYAGIASLNPAYVPASRRPHRYWLDLSQFKINPYFSLLFGDRMDLIRGRSHISLSRLYDAVVGPYHTSLLAAFDSMSFTYPPCKSIGVYHGNEDQDFNRPTSSVRPLPGHRRAHSPLELLGRIYNPEGITVSQVISTLHEHSSTVLHAWFTQAGHLRQEVTDGHWIDDIWHVSGAPKFHLLLDNSSMTHGLDDGFHISRQPYFCAEGYRAEREGEWVPRELHEPAKTTTVRSQIRWNR